MKKLLPVLFVGLSAFALGLGGCEDAYGPSVRYPAREDPVLMVLGTQFADEERNPDRPGQLPLLSIAGIFDVRNPLYSAREKIENTEKLRDPTKITAADRRKLEELLDKLFGTPAKPTVLAYDDDAKKAVPLSSDVQKTLKLDDATLETGSKLYRIHCVHCHGVPGDGRGPTAPWVNPHPRDFRQGLFKFQSVDQLKTGANAPPRREDLLRTLEFGLEGSAMPAFTLLTDNDREALVSYVIHLSLRGNAEFEAIKGAFEWDSKTRTLKVADADTPPETVATVIHARNLENWVKSQANAIVAPPQKHNQPDALAKSVRRGQQLFIGKADADADKKMQDWAKAANCMSCHNDYGRQSLFRWDDWGTLVKPPNLTQGIYRGGRRPIDLYYRIHSGINGAGMARFGENLPPEAVWDLVNFVRSLPYPAMRAQAGIQIP
jgi:mono/diheme cytochrome c family protein